MPGRLSLGIAVALAACSGGPGPVIPPGCSGVTADGSNPTHVLTGAPVTLRFELNAECPAATAIEASVLEPSLRTVESTGSLAGHIASVTFTPRVGGPHHITVRLQPGRGTVQADLTVTVDRRGEPAQPVALPLDDLDGAELTSAGRLISPVTHRIFTLDGDGGVTATQQLPGGMLAIAGDVAWSYTDAGVTRWVLAGQSYVMTPDASIDVPAELVFPSSDDVRIITPSDVVVASVTPSGFDVRAFARDRSFAEHMHVAGNWLTKLQPTSWCSTLIDGDGGSTCRTHSPANGRFVGGDATGFWATAGTTLVRSRLAVDEVDTVESWSAVLSSIGAWRSRLPMSKVEGLDVVAAEANDRIVLEHWGEVVSATASTVITRSDAGVIHVRRR